MHGINGHTQTQQWERSLIDVPDRMKHLDRDHRGYPIPFIVFRDNDNKPHFTINDAAQNFSLPVTRPMRDMRRELLRGRWFVGGPMSALAPLGAYIDPPLHHECMRFALQTCPYLVIRQVPEATSMALHWTRRKHRA